MECSPDAILVSDKDGYLLEYNQQFLRFWGFTDPRELGAKPYAEMEKIMSLLKDPAVFPLLSLHEPGQQEVQVWDFHELVDGRIVERRGEPLKVSGEYLGRIWFYRDVTDLRNARKLLEEKIAILRGVYNKSMDGLLVVDLDRNILAFNKVYLDLFRMEESFLMNESPEVVIEHCVLQLREKDKFREEVYAMIGNPGVEKSSIQEFLDGRIVERVTETIVVEGKAAGRIFFYRDITDSANRINELINRTYELDKFIYSASHDLKAPLNSIMGLVSILRMEELEASSSGYVDLISRCTQKLDSHIRSLAEFSHNQNLVVAGAPIILYDLLEGIWEDFYGMEGIDRIDFRLEVPRGMVIHSDPVRMKIVLKQLLSNGVKYQKTNPPDSWIHVQAKVEGDELQIRISDNGIGIENDQLEQIFGLFYRATNQGFGSGLGLYVALQTIQKIGGSLTCQSELGHGSSFFANFPGVLQSRN